MTSFFEGSIEYVIINKRINDNWYISEYKNKSQKKNILSDTQTYYNTNYYKSKSKESNPYGILVKIVIAVVIFGIIFNHFNNQQSPGSQSQASHTKTAQVFANVVYCEWLNVRSSPSSINDRNIIEAIRNNTRVEITEYANNGWVRIKYGNNKTGYVYSNHLSK